MSEELERNYTWSEMTFEAEEGDMITLTPLIQRDRSIPAFLYLVIGKKSWNIEKMPPQLTLLSSQGKLINADHIMVAPYKVSIIKRT